MNYKKEIVKLLQKEKIKDIVLEVPPNNFGDYAFPCFKLENPNQKAKELASKIKSIFLEKVEARGPYLNFFINKKYLAENTIKEILKLKEKYGSSKENKKIMVEYETPNTNKPLHLGHLRNASIGMSISNIFEFIGNKVIRADLFNDRGIHICQAMLAYEKFINKKPNKKRDHFVGDAYVLFNQKVKKNPELQEQAYDMLIKFELGDKKIITLWKKIDSWAVNGIKETDKIFGNKFDVYFRETKFYKKAKPLIEEGLIKKIFERDEEGNIIAKLEPNLPNKILQRKDGTSIYITNDLALVPHKFSHYKIDKSIWVVASEQNLYFQQLFEIFKRLGYGWVKNCKHLSYGMVFLPEGKMKSREGKVIDADDLIEEMKLLAIKELEKRHKLNKKEKEKRALKIALAAIKYFFLKIDIVKDMVFNPEEAINFEGDSGPYLQYSYARANSILKKAKNKSSKFNIFNLEEKEIELIKKLAEFPDVVKNASVNYAPNVIANYSFKLGQIFNEFYQCCKVIGSKEENQRLAIVQAFKIVMKNSLNLLEIDVIEEM
jgi:arginyl-tRNA synthetase